MKIIDTSSMKQLTDIARSDSEDFNELVNLASEAEAFLLSHRWCHAVQRVYLDGFWPGITAVFFVEIEPATNLADDAVWVIVGDLPPAYLDILNSANRVEAIQAYIYAMGQWVDHVRTNKPVDEVIPVLKRNSLTEVEPTMKNAALLKSRLHFIRDRILLSQRPDTIGNG